VLWHRLHQMRNRQTDRQTPHSSVTIVCISCIPCSLRTQIAKCQYLNPISSDSTLFSQSATWCFFSIYSRRAFCYEFMRSAVNFHAVAYDGRSSRIRAFEATAGSLLLTNVLESYKSSYSCGLLNYTWRARKGHETKELYISCMVRHKWWLFCKPGKLSGLAYVKNFRRFTNTEQVAKVVWRRPHRIRGGIGTPV